ncbi:ComEC/Rec2 family competence protein [Natrinema versiforme]|uniref:Beta-lactamase domain-containing protein n=1 Tax=Natrinema versiforme JCM 10478 TaxID=1227496 RepID=L9XYC5_9EURY|nr:MBL fold metallo-hydrolase [Natrinema versiforme]ELY66839.1 beta-lactamase domain-containing protein [Natrinema versiforme JCM 10478]
MRRGVLVVAVAGLLVLAGCSSGLDSIGGGDGPASDVSGDLEIHHIDAGQADSTLVVTPAGETILIDTGDYRDDGQEIIDSLEARDIDRIDHLVATHGHADHIGGHPEVIEYLEEEGDGVGAAYDSGVPHTTATYDNYLDAIEEYDVRLFEVAAGDDLPLEDDDLEATVLNPPEGGEGDSVDANGVVLSLSFGEFSYLTTGDIEASTERRLVEDHGESLAADAYQAGHHGSSTSSSDPFLKAVDPETAIISSALDSQYGHPHDEVLQAFADRGVETYWTGVHGDIVLTSDGTDASVETERDAPTDPEALLERKQEAQSSLEPPQTIEPRAAGNGVHPVTGGDRPAIDGAGARTAGH